MSTKFCLNSILLLCVAGFVIAAENYIDYRDELSDRTAAENIHELYKLLMQRNALESAGLGEVPYDNHLMIRKSQRSPSLRLRFGRSDPNLSVGLLPRFNGIPSSRFDNK